MKKFLLLILCICLSGLQGFCAQENEIRTSAKTCKKPEINELFVKNFGHRAITYNAIGLTKEQIAQKEIIDAKRFEAISPMYEQLDDEVFNLRKLRASNAGNRQIKRQAKVVKKLRKSIDKVDKKYDREFQKCLTSLQKAKFHDIQRLHRRDIMLKINDADSKYYDKNLPIFGQE